MNTNLKSAFLQGSSAEASAAFHEYLRQAARESLWQAMEAEIEALCGAKYHPNPQSDYKRAGSDLGSVYLGSKKQAIRKPRVRKREGGEVQLKTYQVASSGDELFEQTVALVQEGISQRGLSRATSKGISKSSISRLWAEKSLDHLSKIRERALDQTSWIALMIDGVYVGKDQCVVVALGIDEDGNKQVLDFEPGSSESVETVLRLISRLVERGVNSLTSRRLLIVRDGSKAIQGAVARVWPEALQQTCLVHLERNISDRLRRVDREESKRLFKRLRQAQGSKAGSEAYDDLIRFVGQRNQEAANQLREHREAALCFHGLDVPSTLNVTFLSSNLIENVIRNWREKSHHVKRWKHTGDMISRWMASGLLWAENGFRKIRHYEDLKHLKEALSAEALASPSAPHSTASVEHVATVEARKKNLETLNQKV